MSTNQPGPQYQPNDGSWSPQYGNGSSGQQPTYQPYGGASGYAGASYQPSYEQPTYQQPPSPAAYGYPAEPPNPYVPAYSAYGGSLNARPAVSFGQAIRLAFKNWNVFSGRASRSEYWYWALGGSLLGMGGYVAILVLGAIMAAAAGTTQSTAGSVMALLMMLLMAAGWLVMVIPSLAAGVRRLHDTNQSGWMLLISLIPLGSLALLVMLAQPSNPAGARYDNPSQKVHGPEDL